MQDVSCISVKGSKAGVGRNAMWDNDASSEHLRKIHISRGIFH